RAASHLPDVLAEVADGHTPIHGHLPRIGRLLARDHAKNRGLARAVGADEPHLFAAIDGGGCLEKEDLLAVLLADGVEPDHEGGVIARTDRARTRVSGR